MTVMPLAHATTTQALSAQLAGYGFTPAASQSIAQQALDFARSHAGQLTTLFIAGSAVGVASWKPVRPDWSWPRKVLTAACWLRRAGVAPASTRMVGLRRHAEGRATAPRHKRGVGA